MATKTIKFKDAKTVIPIGLARPFKNAKIFFDLWAVKVLAQAFLSFRLQGARGGHPAWRPFSANTLRMPSGTWRIRYGTDIKPRGREFMGRFWQGVRRYSGDSKMMQASGLFRNSFQTLKISNRNAIVGTQLRIAKEIMSSGGGRPVLFVTGSDKIEYTNMFRNFVDKGIKF